jgi:hypothetical protein
MAQVAPDYEAALSDLGRAVRFDPLNQHYRALLDVARAALST